LIGQIVSDIVSVDAAGSSNGVVYADTFELCIPQDPNILVDTTNFNTKDFAYKVNFDDKFVSQALAITAKDGQWCANVNKDGYYVAALTSAKPVNNSAIGVLMSLISLIAILLLS